MLVYSMKQGKKLVSVSLVNPKNIKYQCVFLGEGLIGSWPHGNIET